MTAIAATASFFSNICRFGGCGLSCDSLAELIGHIEENRIEFENKQLKWSYPLSFNADSDSTHAKYLNAQSCTSANTDARERARLA
ncbi:unnamed protein product [Boreogadus saida]